MEHNPQTERPTRREQANADSISQAKQVIDQIEQIINEGLDETDCEVFKRMMHRVAENVARALKA